jgi:hypothetical protein
MQEVWLPVVGFEGLYEVSDWGRVKSLARKDADGGRRIAERILKPAPNKGGYLLVALHKNKKQHGRLVHRLVAEAFIGPRPTGLQVCHGIGGKADNSLANLRYGTATENAADKLRDGTAQRGEQHGQAKLTAEKVLEARRRTKAGTIGSATQLAREWNVSQSSLSNAICGKSWAWLTD